MIESPPSAIRSDCAGLSEDEINDLKEAVRVLESVGLAARFASIIGKPIELLVSKLPGEAAGKSLTEVLPRILLLIAQRFGAPVTLKLSAQAAPVFGGITGAALNHIFMDHFQDKARAHFAVRRLERRHGGNQIKACYEAVADYLERTGAIRRNTNPHPAP